MPLMSVAVKLIRFFYGFKATNRTFIINKFYTVVMTTYVADNVVVVIVVVVLVC